MNGIEPYMHLRERENEHLWRERERKSTLIATYAHGVGAIRV